MVVVSDHRVVKEMFSQSAFSGRLDLFFLDFFKDGHRHGKENENKYRIRTIPLTRIMGRKLVMYDRSRKHGRYALG